MRRIMQGDGNADGGPVTPFKWVLRSGAVVLLAGWLAVALGGCGVLDQDRRVITEALDDSLAPEHTAAKVALAPVAIPLGMATLAVDGAVVNPIRRVPEAADDAAWVFTDLDYTGLWEAWVFPMRLVTCPIIFIGSEVIYCTIPSNL